MKKLFALLLLVSAFSQAQELSCQRTGDWVIPAGGYSVSGNVYLVDSAGELYIRFSSDYATTVGPDVQILLSPTATWDSLTDYFVIDLAASGSLFSGAQEFKVPGDIGLDQYSHILMHCVEYNHMWAYVALGTKTGQICDSQNGIADSKLSLATSVYPNPTTSSFSLESEANVASIEILDSRGTTVVHYNAATTYDVSALENGFYSILAKTDEGTILKQLIVE